MKAVQVHDGSCTDYVKWHYINVSWDGIEGTAAFSYAVQMLRAQSACVR